MAALTMDKVIKESIATLRPRVEAALKAQGFGILTEIDVRATMKAKLDAEFRPYVILGACNPRLAHRALTAAPVVGALLPCNVVLDEELPGHTRVRVFDPETGLGLVGVPALNEIGAEAKVLLAAALATL